jgi:signal transduction histidine kinase
MQNRIRAAVRASASRGVGAARALWNRSASVLGDWSQPTHLIEDARLRRRATAAMWVAAAAVSFIGFGNAAGAYDVDRVGLGVMPFLGALAGLPLGLVLSRPMLGWFVSASGAFLVAEVLPPQDRDPWPWLTVHGLVLLALLFAVSAREPAPRALGAWLTTSALFAWGVPSDITTGWVVGVTIVVVIGLLAGRLLSTNRALAHEAEVSSTEKARRVLLEERARIARDLHDIVAHHMSMVVVQAETAPYRVPDLSESAREELDTISASARAALGETRSLLSILRRDEEPAQIAPQPGLEQLNDLMADARRAGVRLEVVRTEVSELRPGASLAAYRIIQEALANAARHAPGATVRMELSRDEKAVHIRVANTPPPGHGATTNPSPPGPVAVPAGHGITGMRERAAAEGGRLDAGPTDDGGFAVSAWIPIGPATLDRDPPRAGLG